MLLKPWYFILLLFFTADVFSQDTLALATKPQSPRVSYVSEIDVDKLGAGQETVDSSLSSFHRTRGFLYDITLERNIFMEKEEVPFQKQVVNFSNDITIPYKYSDRTIRYYKLNKRFTEITYLLGRKKEQLVNIIYTQNLFRGWNAGLDFRRAGAEGPFKRQQFYQSSFDMFTHYESPNERYNLYAYYLRNRLEQNENGGIKDFDPDENTVAQPTYLSSAENNQTDKEFLLRQSFRLAGQTIDSMPTAKNIFTAGHKVRYETRGNAYFDNPADSFYKYNHLDSITTSDSTWYQRWNNEIILKYDADTSGALSVSLSGGHEYFIYKYGSPEAAFIFGQKENYYSSAGVNWNKNKNYLDGKLFLYFGDYNGDYDFRFNYSRLFTILNQQLKLFVAVNQSKAHPNISDIRRYSNHFIWFNEFVPVRSQNTEVGFKSTDEKFLASSTISLFEDLVYYDSTSTPRQFNKTTIYFKIKLQRNFTWHHWIFENTMEYLQTDTETENIIHLPEFMTGHSLCYEKYFFKKALFARIGMDVRYVSSYYADRYMPALQQFYLQYDKKTGGYILADFFITFRVKASRFFIKLDNVFNGVSPEPQFVRPDYPLTPRALRFGLQLRFFD